MENTVLKNQIDVHFDEMTALLDFDVQKYITSLQEDSIVTSPEEASAFTETFSDFWDQICFELN